MAILIKKRPNEKCWSGNPIHYHLYSAAAEADTTMVIEVMILFKRTDAAGYSEITSFPYSPVMGNVKIDIQDILDGLMEYETPGIPLDFEYSSPTTCRKQTGLFYIKFREVTTAAPDPAWVGTESANARFVIKGGISFQKWRGDAFWINYFDPLKPFLTWHQSGRLASKKERMYLAWYNHTTVNSGYIKMRRYVFFSDGTQDVADIDTPMAPNEVLLFPSGYNQLKLDEIDSSKRVHYWEMEVWDINSSNSISQKFRYYLDNRNDKNEITLNYRNSLGGFDSLRIRGVIEYNLERQYEKAESIVIHDYFEGNFINPRTKAANSTETLIYKGDLGFLSKEEQDRMRDTHFRRECWWEQQGKWLPVMILTNSQKLKTSNDQLWSMPIEFCIADGGDKYYTPSSVNLAEGALPNVQLCNAVISIPTVLIDGDGYHVDWDLVSGAPSKYQISTAAIAGGAPYETNLTQWIYSFLPVGDHVIRVTPLCLIGGDYVQGVPKEVTITVAPVCIGVGITGAPDLPNATAGSDYAYYFTLTGTAPFALANVVKPAWMTISLVGNTINFSGTPLSGDVGEAIDVSFDITNCGAGNTVSFEDELNVIEPTNNLEIVNTVTGCKIDNVSPTFYIIETGAFPLLGGQVINATHGGHSGPINVSITGDGGSHSLRLYKNGVLVQIIPVVASTIYIFSTVTFVAGDSILIIL